MNTKSTPKSAAAPAARKATPKLPAPSTVVPTMRANKARPIERPMTLTVGVEAVDSEAEPVESVESMETDEKEEDDKSSSSSGPYFKWTHLPDDELKKTALLHVHHQTRCLVSRVLNRRSPIAHLV